MITAHRTLWRPTPTETPLTDEEPHIPHNPASTAHRTGPWVQLNTGPPREGENIKDTAKKHYWHHFDEDEAAWPKVVLILSSTESTTTRIKSKKTFSTYFPQVKYRTTENVASDDQNDIEENGDKLVYPEEEDEMQDAEEDIYVRNVAANDIISRTPTAKTPRMSTNTTSRMPTIPILRTPTAATRRTRTPTTPTALREAETETEGTTTYKVKCYQCGFSNGAEIPYQPTCNQIFDPNERKYAHLKPHCKVTCGGNGPNSFNPESPRHLYKGNSL